LVLILSPAKRRIQEEIGSPGSPLQYSGERCPSLSNQPSAESAGDPQPHLPDALPSQDWWVDARGNVWQATETKGSRTQGLAEGYPCPVHSATQPQGRPAVRTQVEASSMDRIWLLGLLEIVSRHNPAHPGS
jgi:hypothetical protein